MVVTKYTITYYLFCFLILGNLVLALLPAWRGSFIWNYVSDTSSYFILTGYSGIVLNFLISIIVLSLNIKIYGRWKILFCFLSMILFTLSMLQKDVNIKQFEGIMAICAYLMLVCVLPQYKFSKVIRNGVLIFLLLWSIIPVVYFFVAPVNMKLLLFSDSGTFSGFALHRNFYGVYAGISFLLLWFVSWPKLYKCLLGGFLLVGLLMSECRTVILCLFVSLVYKKYSQSKIFYVYLILLGIIGIVCYLFLVEFLSDYMMRRDLDNNAMRQELYQGFWNIICENPLLGKGENVLYYSSTYPDGAPAHNFVLQIIANNGIFAMFCFVAFYIAIFKSLSSDAKCIFLFLIITGMFQPYVDSGFPTVLTVVVLFICQIYSYNIYEAK